MDACETIFVQSDVAPGDIVRWLHAWAWELVPPCRGSSWVIGPRAYGYNGTLPTAYETMALYALRAGQSFEEGEVALSITLLPLRRRWIALDLRRWSSLPVALETVVRQLAAYFPDSRMIVSSAAPPRAARGAPPLPCNSWLEAQLTALQPPANPRPLYPGWLEQYRAVRGHYPVESYRSFRAAVEGCRRRMQAQRTR